MDNCQWNGAALLSQPLQCAVIHAEISRLTYAYYVSGADYNTVIGYLSIISGKAATEGESPL